MIKICTPIIFTVFEYTDGMRDCSLSLDPGDGASVALQTTGYRPYSGNGGLGGVGAPIIDEGTFRLYPPKRMVYLARYTH